jgi:hypothetical protein
MGVTTKHPQYTENESKWQKCRDAFDGGEAVKARGETYLPKLGGQNSDDYDAYTERALYYNATARTIQGWLGCVFRKDPQIAVPDSIQQQLQDVTLTGIPIEALAKTALQEVLTVGRYGILVDMPTEESPERRPYLIPFKTEQIVNWQTARRQGDVVLSMVVLRETEAEPQPEDAFEIKNVEQYRVLTLEGDALNTYTVRVWRQVDKNDADSWAPVEEYIPKLKGQPLDFIPFCFIGPNTILPDVEKSPSEDLVDVNLSHYRSSADLEHGRHYTALPTVWVAGFPTEGTELRIGSQTAWITDRTDAKAGILEFTGQGLGALEKALSQKEAMMAALGARLLEDPKRAAEAAEAIRLRLGGEQVALTTIANTASLALTIVLQWFADWAGVSGDVTVRLNTEFFEQQMDPAMLRELVTVWQGGAIAKATLYHNMERSGLTRPGVDFEQEQAEVQAGAVL